MRKPLAVIATAALLSASLACGGAKPRTGSGPGMAGLTTQKGKGIPNGRSDSAERHFTLTEHATHPEYGFTPERAVKVGGAFESGSGRQKAFLNGLRGPAGQPVEYERIGSCCMFETPNGFNGHGMLDAFRITYDGQSAEITIYINLYDQEPMLIPNGFTARRE